ncbi:MAG: ornithine cyclodeaminase family protein [Thermaerobacter sp.]|nr:ornithine cyclodeaminase [Bacillota bacterium]REJ38413.1 MAG: ornithine cyclodeaminase [Bacillota bacterium]
MKIRWLSGDDVASVLTMEAAVEAVRQAYVAVYRRTVQMPLRMHLPSERYGGLNLFMPSSDPDLGRTVLKALSVYGDNPARGLPAIMGVVLVFDAVDGRPLAVMDAARLTGLRTGAASGVSSQVLARPDSRVLAVIGAGAQAPFQVDAVLAVRPIEEVRLYSRTRSRAEALAAQVRQRRPDLRVVVTDSAGAAVREADIICTATNAVEPVLADADVKPGTHVSAVGSFTPAMRELPADLLARAGRVYVDQREAALEEAGEVIHALQAGVLAEDALIELGAVLAGEAEGRRDPEEVTVFKSSGLAAQDLYAAARALEAAESRGAGVEVSL